MAPRRPPLEKGRNPVQAGYGPAALLWSLLLLLGTAPPAPAQDETGPVGPAEVQVAIERGKEAVLRHLRVYKQFNDPGYRMLAVLALLNAGVSCKDQRIKDSYEWLVRNAAAFTRERYHGTYLSGMLLMVLEKAQDPQNQNLAEQMKRNLLTFQEASGGWGDFSRTQFALLGLKSAEDLGLSVPKEVYERALKFVQFGQNPDGGWNYLPNRGTSYGSMTVAGISSLYICGAQLYKGTTVCGKGETDKHLARGLDWLAGHFSVATNPGATGHHFYYLYGLERVGVLLAQRTLGRHDWYREGAEFLVGRQKQDGGWSNQPLETEFALLFLGKGSQPVAIQKLRYGPDWNRVPYDAKLLTERASKDLTLPMTWETVAAGSSAEELARAPILYLQGHEALRIEAKFGAQLAAFVDQGGFIVASACCASPAFDKSFREEILRLFPDSTFERLPASHPIYQGPHRIQDPAAFMIEGVNAGCRTSILYAPHDLCCAWGGCKGCTDPACLKGEDSYRLGVNLVAYALGYQKLKDKLEEVEVHTRNAETPGPQRGTLLVGQLYHDGDWNPDPASLPNLTQTLREQAGLQLQVAKQRVVLGSAELGDYPLLYLTGHKAFAYRDEEAARLRSYLDNGGFLLADPCCGKGEFDLAFKALCQKLFPNTPLDRLPQEHPLLLSPFKIQAVHYTPWAMRLFPKLGNEPHLEGITHRGRLAVLYSRLNLGCALQGHSCSNCVAVEAKDAYKIAVNALLYALGQ